MLGVTELYELGSQQWVTTEVEGLPRILRREPQSLELSLISRQPTEVHHWQTNIGNGMNELHRLSVRESKGCSPRFVASQYFGQALLKCRLVETASPGNT